MLNIGENEQWLVYEQAYVVLCGLFIFIERAYTKNLIREEVMLLFRGIQCNIVFDIDYGIIQRFYLLFHHFVYQDLKEIRKEVQI